VTGAGDTVLSVLALAAAAGAPLADAAMLANTAAGVVVGKLGTASVTRRNSSMPSTISAGDFSGGALRNKMTTVEN